MNEALQTICNQEYSRAREFYSAAGSVYLGKLLLSQTDCVLPIDIGPVYRLMIDAVERDKLEAEMWAEGFGALGVKLALKQQDSSFTFVPRSKLYDRNKELEISTSSLRPIEQQLTMTETDSPTSFLIALNDQPITAEMALIQAMHLIDAAIVTGQYTGRLPLVRFIDQDSLLALKTANPDLLLRLYGNVRGKSGVPDILGTVLRTDRLESSGISTIPLRPPIKQLPERPIPELRAANGEKEAAAFVGITVAKKPHIGHGFLLVQAMALRDTVIVELNDTGPRINQAVVELAAQLNVSVQTASSMINQGQIPMKAIEQAYQKRAEFADISEVPSVVLRSAIDYYRQLLAAISPPNKQIVTIADSELAPYRVRLAENSGYLPLFGNSGMAIIRSNEGIAVPVELGGKLTIQGILGSIAARYDLEVVDDPPPITKFEQRTLAETGLVLKPQLGAGVLIDFEQQSGTKGGTITLERLADRLAGQNYDVSLLLPAMRLVLDRALCIPSETGSMRPNFASPEAFLAIFDAAAKEIATKVDSFAGLSEPIKYVDVARPILKQLVDPTYATSSVQGRPTQQEVRSLIGQLPILARMFSRQLVNYVAASNDTLPAIPKNIPSDKDRKLIDMLRSGSSQLLDVIAQQVASDASIGDKLYEQSDLGAAVRVMGYPREDFARVLKKLSSSRGMYINGAVR